MRVDVSAFLGGYPFRRVPGTAPEALVAAMDRVNITDAWVSHLPSVFWRAPTDGNPWLFAVAERHPRLRPVPAVHPGLPDWESAVGDALRHHAPAVRCDPTWYGLDPAGPEMRALATTCAAARLPLMMAVRFEDARQRHPRDSAPELPAAAIRALVRSDPALRLLVTHADRAFIQEVHFGSTAAEASRVWWDIAWVWGPPEDHLATLVGTVGVERFVFGTGQPLRLPELAVARLDLLDLTPDERALIEHGTAVNDLGR